MATKMPEDKQQWKQRLTVDLPEDVYNDFCDLVPHGCKRDFTVALFRDVLEWLKQGDNRQLIIGGVMTGHIKFTQILRKAQQKEGVK